MSVAFLFCAPPILTCVIFELHVDLNVFISISVPPHVLERLAERCRVQADAVLVETPARPDVLSDPVGGGGSEDTDNMKRHCNLLNDSNKGCLLS